MTGPRLRPGSATPGADSSGPGEPQLVVAPSLGRWRGDWDALVAAADLPSPFLRSWWLAAADGRPQLLLVFRRGCLVGGLALQEDRCLGVPRLRTLGGGALCPDHLDLVADRGEETTVARAVSRWMLRPGNRIIDLGGLAATHRLALDTRRRVAERFLAPAPWVDLTVDPDTYLAARRSRLRHTIRRRQAKLSRAGAAYHWHRDADRGIDVLVRLHRERWGQESSFLARLGAFAVAAGQGARAGEVTFHELVLQGRAIACEVIFEVADRASFYQAGRSLDADHTGAGTVLKAAVIESCRQRGFVEYDLLRGGESYKRDWATGERALVTMETAVGVGAWASRAAGAVATRLGRFAASHLPARGGRR